MCFVLLMENNKNRVLKNAGVGVLPLLVCFVLHHWLEHFIFFYFFSQLIILIQDVDGHIPPALWLHAIGLHVLHYVCGGLRGNKCQVCVELHQLQTIICNYRA